MNTDKLNAALGKGSFNSTFEIYNFNFLTDTKDGGMSGGITIGGIRKQEYKKNDDTSFSIGGFNTGFQLGYDLISPPLGRCSLLQL